MYAIAVDGELLASGLGLREVKAALKGQEDSKVEIATFLSGRGWVPVCLDFFDLAQAA